jgi:hypothetical protein
LRTYPAGFPANDPQTCFHDVPHRVPVFEPGDNELHRSVRIGAEPEYTFGRRTEMTISTSARFEQTEGAVARAIEGQTAKLPSDTFLWAAVASMATSATLQLMGNKQASVFVGQWAPTFLILGVYNKLVKQLGSDSRDNRVRA